MTLLGILALILIDLVPHIAFSLVWISPIIILEPLETAIGYKSILSRVANGEWELPISIGVGTLITGIFWEMWNYYSLPKWIYTIPYVGFWKIFEIPFWATLDIHSLEQSFIVAQIWPCPICSVESRQKN